MKFLDLSILIFEIIFHNVLNINKYYETAHTEITFQIKPFSVGVCQNVHNPLEPIV